MPVVSVIIPCFNQGEFIKETLESVLNQTFPDFEVIITDDGSDDIQTKEILKSLNHPKIRVIFSEHKGVCHARNLAISEARGEYILPLDADDKIGKTYLKKAVDIFSENPNIGIVYCEAEYFGLLNGKWDLPSYSLEGMLNQNCIFVSAMFRKADWAKVGGFNPNMSLIREDWDFWLSLIENGAVVFRIPKTLFYYRKQASSRSSVTQQSFEKSALTIVRNHINLYAQHFDCLRGEMKAAFFDVKNIRSILKIKNINKIKYFILFFVEKMKKIPFFISKFFNFIKIYILFPFYVYKTYKLVSKRFEK